MTKRAFVFITIQTIKSSFKNLLHSHFFYGVRFFYFSSGHVFTLKINFNNFVFRVSKNVFFFIEYKSIKSISMIHISFITSHFSKQRHDCKSFTKLYFQWFSVFHSYIIKTCSCCHIMYRQCWRSGSTVREA